MRLDCMRLRWSPIDVWLKQASFSLLRVRRGQGQAPKSIKPANFWPVTSSGQALIAHFYDSPVFRKVLQITALDPMLVRQTMTLRAHMSHAVRWTFKKVAVEAQGLSVN
jgi:hypothetical protein